MHKMTHIMWPTNWDPHNATHTFWPTQCDPHNVTPTMWPPQCDPHNVIHTMWPIKCDLYMCNVTQNALHLCQNHMWLHNIQKFQLPLPSSLCNIIGFEVYDYQNNFGNWMHFSYVEASVISLHDFCVRLVFSQSYGKGCLKKMHLKFTLGFFFFSSY